MNASIPVQSFILGFSPGSALVDYPRTASFVAESKESSLVDDPSGQKSYLPEEREREGSVVSSIIQTRYEATGALLNSVTLVLVVGGFLFCCLSLSSPAQGIPEPDFIMYGTVQNVTSNANIRLGYGTLTWVLQPSGGGSAITATATLTNINDQFSYIMRIPCETPVPGFAPSSNTIPLTPFSVAFNRSQVAWNGNLLAFVQPSLTNITFQATDRGRIERVDLNASLPLVFDVNGLPVDWEMLYFGRTGIDPYADPDGDGLNNLAEYKAGTNPNDPGSNLRFIGIRRDLGGISVDWLSTANHLYVLQRSPSLSAGFVDFASSIAATPPANSFRDTNAIGAGSYFYRLKLEP